MSAQLGRNPPSSRSSTPSAKTHSFRTSPTASDPDRRSSLANTFPKSTVANVANAQSGAIAASPQVSPPPIVLSDYLELRNYTDTKTGTYCTWIATRQVCPEGRFCPLNVTSTFPCPSGFYCPYDTAHPSYCCKGFFCEKPSSIKLCPPGYFCPTGSTAPISCGWIYSLCPSGSSRPIRPGVFLMFTLVCIISALLFMLRSIFANTQRNKVKPSKWTSELVEPNKSSSNSNKSSTTAVITQLDLPTNTEIISSPSSQRSNSPPITKSSTFVLPEVSPWGLFGGSSTVSSSGEAESTIHFHIRFENLTKRLPNGTVILRDVTGEMRPSKLCAIMGLSGSGKSTLLHTLAGKTNRTSGKVFLNDYEDEMQNYSKLVGFVPQEDIMIRDLTVRDILRHSAFMRLPGTLTTQEKNCRVTDLMAYLGLTHVADTIIGDERVRGISGGQRKRVNIGMELIASPSILFLDEPTSGLDSSTSLELCQLLRRIATEKGLVVAAVVHSPSQQCLDLFDDLILLGNGGHVIYTGSRLYAMPYFSNLGFIKPPNQSEPEFYLDIIAGKVPLLWNPSFRAVDLFDYWNAFVNKIDIDTSQQGAFSTISVRARDRDAASFQRKRNVSKFVGKVVSPLTDVFHQTREYLEDVIKESWTTIRTLGVLDPVRETPSPFYILGLCMKRASQQVWRKWSSFFVETAVHMAAGTFISLAAQQNEYLGKYPPELCDVTPYPLLQHCLIPFNTVTSSGMFIAISVLFAGISTSANTFGLERVVYWRDVASGMPTFPYFCAKMLVDIPRVLIAGILYAIALMFLWPYRGEWLPLMIAVVSLYFTAFSMGYFISTISLPSSTGVMATSFSLLWALVLGGVIPNLSDVNKTGTVYNYFKFLWELSAPRYFIEAVFLLEARGRSFEELKDVSVYEDLGYDRDGYWATVVNIIVIGLIWQTAALLGMKLTERSKQK